MTIEALALLLILAAALVLFYTQWLRTDLTAILVLLSLVVPWRPAAGGLQPLLPPAVAFSGFGTPAVMMVAAMFVVSAGMVRTGAAELLGRRLFERTAHSEPLLQAAVLVSVTLFSSMVNDTTAVLVWMPVVITVCRERGLSPARYLILVAYGALLGGQWTLIGTRSNIIVSDFLREHEGHGLGFFQFTPVAVAVFVLSLVFFLTVGVRFLPRLRPDEDLAEAYQVTEFLTEVMVTPQSSACGQTLAETRLKETHGVEVIEIIRGHERLPASAWLRVVEGDVLIVQGPSSRIARLLKTPQFQIREEMKVADGTLRSVDLVMVEAIVNRNSALIGRRLRDVPFLDDFGFSPMAVAREERRRRQRPADLVLRFGDTLLLYGHQQGLDRLRRGPEVLLVESQPFPILERWRAFLMLGILALGAGAAASDVLPPATALPLAAAATVLSGCLKMREVYTSVDWTAIVVMGGMIPYGFALERTGTAAAVARATASLFSGASPTLLLGALLFVSLVLTQVIGNTAVAVILSPLFYNVAIELGLDPAPVLLALALSISSAFMTPVAHEATILVAGPGRYRFQHYLAVGSGFALITWLLTTLLVPALYDLGR